MCDFSKRTENCNISPQCQYFVLRKKRLCRMTVKPGNHYCGEHEPQPKTGDGQDDTRIPCPYDPKHTCYASKLEKHLSICNARQQDQPDYIVHNINAPIHTEDCPRMPLAKIPLQKIKKVIEKINLLYDTYLKDKIQTLPQQPIHSAVIQEFSETGRTESSLRHLRQASSLLHVVESEGLVTNNTTYVELGAGKGQLSYYAWWAWCQGTDSRVLLVDRASLRHKRDNKLRDDHRRLQSSDELHDDALLKEGDKSGESRDSYVQRIRADLAHLVLERVPAVRASAGVVGYAKHLCGVATDYALRCLGESVAVRGAALAACCHHRCERAAYPATAALMKLGIDGDDFNTLLGIVSWATCGDGRSRDRRNPNTHSSSHADSSNSSEQTKIHNLDEADIEISNNVTKPDKQSLVDNNSSLNSNLNIIHDTKTLNQSDNSKLISRVTTKENITELNNPKQLGINQKGIIEPNLGTKNLDLAQEEREKIGRRAKAILDWGRVQYLQEREFEARLVYYVPTGVSLENVCIVARKVS